MTKGPIIYLELNHPHSIALNFQRAVFAKEQQYMITIASALSSPDDTSLRMMFALELTGQAAYRISAFVDCTWCRCVFSLHRCQFFVSDKLLNRSVLIAV